MSRVACIMAICRIPWVLAFSIFVVREVRGAGLCISPKYEPYPQHAACIKASSFSAKPKGVSGTDVVIIVSEINRARGDVGATDMQKVTWDDELASLAQRWAETCNNTHDETLFVPGRFAAVGQTTGAGYNSWRAAVVAWQNEGVNFVYQNTTASSYPTVANYAQLVWATATKVGCGFSSCFGLGDMFVCNYAPGQATRLSYSQPYRYTNGSACGLCTDKCDLTSRLCNCLGKVCQNGGILALNTCQCSCPNALYTGDSCGLNCTGTVDPPGCPAAGTCQGNSPVAIRCPNACQLCPYAAFDYTSDAGTTATISSTSGTKASHCCLTAMAVISLCVAAMHAATMI